jgi:hypothetical protein
MVSFAKTSIENQQNTKMYSMSNWVLFNEREQCFSFVTIWTNGVYRHIKQF